ncbi:MAG TPA: OmpA family protein [Kofleriaceae bacterium]|nr:OmpA family protein [Kofleriaceae bacterium]
MSGIPDDDQSQSGVLVYPRLQVPPPRRDEARQPTKLVRTGREGGGRSRHWIAWLVLGAAAGGAGAWFARPLIAPDARIAAATERANAADAAAASQKKRADELEASLDATAKAKRDAEAKLTVASAAQSELAGKTADAASRHDAAVQVQAKLKPLIDRAWGQVSLDGDDVHVVIADRMLWKPNDDALTDRGKLVLGKLAGVLKDLPERQVEVAGHTDDQPIPQPRPVPAAPPAKKGGKPVPAPIAPAPRFATNWELSAARALAVVHFLQDTGKLDPARLAAQAFGQYAPISSRDKAANRRLEIVLVARRPITK